MGTKKKTESITKTTLTPASRRQLPKARAGFAVFVEPLLAVYKAHIEEMRIAGIDPAATLAKLRTYQALAAKERVAQAELTLIKDGMLESGSDIWSELLEIYAHAQVIGRTDPVTKAEIADFERFLKPRKRKSTPVAQDAKR